MINQKHLIEPFPAKPFSPSERITVHDLKSLWAESREFAWDVLGSDMSGLTRTERVFAPLFPFIFLLNLIIVMIPLQLIYSTPQQNYVATVIANPAILLPVVVFIIITIMMMRFTRRSKQLLNSADSTVAQSVDEWIKKRYSVEVDYVDNIISVLTEENPKKPSTGYWLTARIIDGEEVLMVVDQDYQEAPTVY